MADKIFLIAKRVMKQVMKCTDVAPPRELDNGEMGDRNYVQSSNCMTRNRVMTHKIMLMNMRQDDGYTWPKQWSKRAEIFAPKKVLSA